MSPTASSARLSIASAGITQSPRAKTADCGLRHARDGATSARRGRRDDAAGRERRSRLPRSRRRGRRLSDVEGWRGSMRPTEGGGVKSVARRSRLRKARQGAWAGAPGAAPAAGASEQATQRRFSRSAACGWRRRAKRGRSRARRLRLPPRRRCARRRAPSPPWLAPANHRRRRDRERSRRRKPRSARESRSPPATGRPPPPPTANSAARGGRPEDDVADDAAKPGRQRPTAGAGNSEASAAAARTPSNQAPSFAFGRARRRSVRSRQPQNAGGVTAATHDSPRNCIAMSDAIAPGPAREIVDRSAGRVVEAGVARPTRSAARRTRPPTVASSTRPRASAARRLGNSLRLSGMWSRTENVVVRIKNPPARGTRLVPRRRRLESLVGSS